MDKDHDGAPTRSHLFLSFLSSYFQDLLPWFLYRARLKGRSSIFDLADNPSPHISSSAVPDPPDPVVSTSAAGTEYSVTSPLPSSRTRDPTSRPPSGVSNLRGPSSGPSPTPATSRRRRRRRLSSPDLSVNNNNTLGVSGEQLAGDHFLAEQSRIQQSAQSEGHPPFPKRRRLANMRSDGGTSSTSTNGRSEVSNGLTASPLRKAAISGALNGQSPTYGASNGQSHSKGSVKSTALGSTYFGHNREEVTRILIQSLYDLDYANAAATLSRESGYELESPPVVALRSAVIDGQWAEAENILLESFRPDGGGDSHGGSASGSQSWGKLLLAENANKNEMLFCLRQQKYLELLEAQDLGAALMVLRQELAPLNHNIAKLHALSR